VFFETCAIGVGATMTSAGQDLEKGRWQEAARSLPQVLAMPPVLTRIDVDDEAAHWTRTLLITVSNAPRAGAGLQLAPRAHMDDGALDVTVFDDLQQADLVTRVAALATGSLDPSEDQHVQHRRCARLRVRATRPLPVAADSKLLGTTPVRIQIQPGAVLVLVGPGEALAHPPSSALRAVVAQIAPSEPARTDAPPPASTAANVDLGALVQRHVPIGVPPALTTGARLAAAPLATALAFKVLPAVAGMIRRHLR
jgi:hypothetical protein